MRVRASLVKGHADNMTMCSRIGRKHRMMIAQPSATRPLFFDNLHFEHFDKSVNHKSNDEPQIHLEMFVKMFEMEIVEKKGTSCRRLVCPTNSLRLFETQDDDARMRCVCHTNSRVTRLLAPFVKSVHASRVKGACVPAVLKSVRAGHVKERACSAGHVKERASRP